MSQHSLLTIDWSTIPAPQDDGAAAHLTGARLPDVTLAATDGPAVSLAGFAGRSVLYVYPMTGQPGVALPAGWDEISGARGCTPQSCAFRDHFFELKTAGAARVFGLSTQDTAYQREAAERMHLQFPLLSDAELLFAKALSLPSFEAAGKTLLKRMGLIIDGGVISKVFYPVFPPDRNAGDVLEWLLDYPK